MNSFKDSGHIFRLAAVFIAGLAIFIAVRGVLVPPSFGKYGHYRGDVACEACHGALANHAADPASVVPIKLDAAVLCARCHQANTAKPSTFPQVIAEEHSAGIACDTCHQPHSPVIVAEGKK